jgi:uncharacterized protein
MSRLMNLQYRMYDRLRHRRAFELAREEGTAPDFDHLRGHRHCLVVTFKRSGEPVPTPVWFVLTDDGRIVFRSESPTAKIRRLRNDPHVRVGPCNVRAKPLGPMAEASGRVLEGEESARGEAALRDSWALDQRIFESGADRMAPDLVYVELVPAARGGEAP